MAAYKVKPAKAKKETIGYYHRKSRTVYTPHAKHQGNVAHHFERSQQWHTAGLYLPPVMPVTSSVGAYHSHKAKSIIRNDNKLDMRWQKKGKR